MANLPEGLVPHMHAMLVETIRQNLKRQVLEALEPDVEAAADEAVAALKLTVKSMEDFLTSTQMIKIILEKRGF